MFLGAQRQRSKSKWSWTSYYQQESQGCPKTRAVWFGRLCTAWSFSSTLIIFGSQFATDLDSPARLKSITQEKDLDEFLNTAQLAGTDFTAGERLFTLSFIHAIL